MLNNKQIKIQECSIEFFAPNSKKWFVDCSWIENNPKDNTEYKDLETEKGRCAVIATISSDGKKVTWKDNFKEAIVGTENDWILEEIQNKQFLLKNNL